MLVGWYPENVNSISTGSINALRMVANIWLALRYYIRNLGYNYDGMGSIQLCVNDVLHDDVKLSDLDQVAQEFIRIYFEKFGWQIEFNNPNVVLMPIR